MNRANCGLRASLCRIQCSAHDVDYSLVKGRGPMRGSDARKRARVMQAAGSFVPSQDSRNQYTARMVPASLLSAILFAWLPIRVEAGACPSSQAIEQRLAGTLSSPAPLGPPDVAQVFRQADLLQIQLVSPDAALIAERTLPYAGTCAELADMVAVILATWESDVHPEFARSAAEPVTGTAAGTVVIAPQPVSSLASARSSRFDLGAGAGVSLADSLTFAGIVAGTWIPRGEGLGVRLWGGGETYHIVSMGTHDARWRRWMVGAGVDWRKVGRVAMLDVHGGLALGLLQASGVGFDQNPSASSAGLVVALGVRASVWASRRWEVNADLTGCSSLRRQFLRGSPAPDREIPIIQGLLTLGLAAREAPTGR